MSEDFPWSSSPRPAPVPEGTRRYVRELGREAGAAGLPPTPPAEFALYGSEWLAGWRMARPDKVSGWREAMNE